MNPGRFYMPGNLGMESRMINNMISNNPMSIYRMANVAPKGMGLFSRITNGIRSVNWGGILNGANKTLNVVNQAIPLVRQAGPMMNNMKSMMKIARAFGSETNHNNTRIVNNNNNNNNNFNRNYNSNLNNSDNNNVYMEQEKKEAHSDIAPNFFV